MVIILVYHLVNYKLIIKLSNINNLLTLYLLIQNFTPTNDKDKLKLTYY